MTEKGYQKVRLFFERRPVLRKALPLLNRFLPLVLYAAYPFLLFVLLFLKDPRFFKAFVIPTTVFLGVTLLRKAVNRPRPYETLAIDPLIRKEKSGESFPSRHVASAFIIAVTFFYVSLPLGVLVGVIACLIAVIRPLAGIHYPSDVIAAALLSVLVGVPAFMFLSF